MAINWMEPFDKIIKLLEMFGLWLDKSSSKCLIAVAVLLHVALNDLIVIFGIIYIVNVRTVEDLSDAVGVIPLMLISCIRTIHFAGNKNRIESMMKDMKELIEEDSWIENQNGSKLKKRIIKIGKIYKIFFASAMAEMIIGSLNPFFTHKLTIKMWIPYDYSNNETLFWLTVAYHNIAGYYIVPITIMTEIVPIYFMSYLTGIIEELSKRMEKICEVKIVKKVKIEPKSDLTEKLVGRLNVATMRKSQAKVAPKAGTSQMIEPKAGTSRMIKPKAGTSRMIEPKQPEEDGNLEELLKCIKIQQKINRLAADVSDVFGRTIWFQAFINSFVLCTAAFSLTIVRTKTLKIREKPLSYFFFQNRSKTRQLSDDSSRL
jgi:7tm Odorant receptor